jgi:hypothetical protein
MEKKAIPTLASERLRRIKEMKVDETPALQAKYEEHLGYLRSLLEKIEPAELRSAKEEIRKEIYKQPSNEALFDLENAIGQLERLRSSKSQETQLEVLAQRSVGAIDDASREAASLMTENIRSALYNLERAVTSLAQAKFPDAFSEQVCAREKRDAGRIEHLRDELMGKKVS